jgi:hypothetical protein
MSQDDETPTQRVGEKLHVHVRVDGQQHDAAHIGTVWVTPSKSHINSSTVWGGITVSKVELARALRVLADSFDPAPEPDELIPVQGWTDKSVAEFHDAVHQGLVPENVDVVAAQNWTPQVFTDELPPEPTEPDEEPTPAIDREVFHTFMPLTEQLRLAAHLSGAEHTLTQHRDGLEPWCPRCGRRGDGRFPQPLEAFSGSGLAFAMKSANVHKAKWEAKR